MVAICFFQARSIRSFADNWSFLLVSAPPAGAEQPVVFLFETAFEPHLPPFPLLADAPDADFVVVFAAFILSLYDYHNYRFVVEISRTFDEEGLSSR